jgi:hypothetical protein
MKDFSQAVKVTAQSRPGRAVISRHQNCSIGGDKESSQTGF